MPQQFEIRDGAASVGSFSGDQIRQMAAAGRLHAGMEIRQLPSGQWAPISKVKGLRFKSPDLPDVTTPEPSEVQNDGVNASPAASAPSQNAATSGSEVVANLAPDPNAVQASATQSTPEFPTSAATSAAEIECPFCAELIKATAKKCKHCGEFLDPTSRPAVGGSAISMAPSRASRSAIPPNAQPTVGDPVKDSGKWLWNLPVPIRILLIAAIPVGLIGPLLLFPILSGPSFQELDAIYKDELGKLEELKHEFNAKKSATIDALRTETEQKYRFAATDRSIKLHDLVDKTIAPAFNKINDQKDDPFNLKGVVQAEFDVWIQQTIHLIAYGETVENSDWFKDDESRRDYAELSTKFGQIYPQLVKFADLIPLSPKEPSQGEMDDVLFPITSHYMPMIAAQQKRVDAANQEKEAAK